MLNISLTIRVVLFSGTALAAIGAGFFLPQAWLLPVFNHSGYYFMFALCLLWTVLVISNLKKEFFARIKKHGPALLLAVGLTVLVFHLSPPKFKILSDETNLVATSMAMHYNKTVAMPVEGTAISYFHFDYHKQTINPRPLLYPFATALFHAFLGYSVYNGMAVNFVLGVGILFLMYMLCALIFSRFWGMVAMILTASFPIYVFWVTSSGFETINLFFILMVFLTLYLFLQSKNTRHAELFLCSLVMLSYCRYESALMIFPVLLLSPYFLNRGTITKYRFFVFCLPLFFVPLVWQRKIVFLNPIVRGDVGLQVPEYLFGLPSLMDNFSRNIFVLTGLDPDFGFLFPVFVMAVAGLYLAIRKLILSPSSVSTALRTWGLYVGLSGLLLFGLYASFFWGQFTTDINNRLAMAMLPFIILPAIYGLYRLFQTSFRPPVFLVILLLGAQLFYYWPAADKQQLLQDNAAHYMLKRVTNYLDRHYDMKNEKLLLISDHPNMYVIFGIGSIGSGYAAEKQGKLYTLSNIYYDHILALQKCSPTTNEVLPRNKLNDGFLLSELYRINVSPTYYLRISEVTCLPPASD